MIGFNNLAPTVNASSMRDPKSSFSNSKHLFLLEAAV
jgi:hypothetical protein